MITFALLLLIADSLGYNCRWPSNNSQRLEWLAELVHRSQTILNQFNRPSWISQGTLLGSVRDGVILEWTGDADVQMFDHDMADICNSTSLINMVFRAANLTIYDCKEGFLRICLANVDNEPKPSFLEADKFTPYAALELYSCTRRADGLYLIKEMPCLWNFSTLFPLQLYNLSSKVKAWGPADAIYFIEQYYGRNWTTPVYYSGDRTLSDICQGRLHQKK